MRKAPSIKLIREERDELSKTARRHTGAMRDSSCAHHPVGC